MNARASVERAFAASMADLAPWPRSRLVAVAVSGGADSMALAALTKRWGDPLALIVDHGLRSESGEEARLTRDRLATLCIPARILTLSGLRRGPALAARARAARYAALESACEEAGLVDLLVAHHRRDQAETVLMRTQAGSRADGLAGMATVVWRGAIRIVRPLLDFPPGALRALLSGDGTGWVEDPSNSDERTLRARLRAGLDDVAGDGETVARLADGARAAGAVRAAREREAAEFLAAHATMRPEGFALLYADQMPAEALAALLRSIGGRDHAPTPDAVSALAAALRPATLGGARILAAGRLDGRWLVAREAGRIGPDVPMHPGLLWDGRFRLGRLVPDGLTIGPLGDAAAGLRQTTMLPSAVLRGLPALRRAGRLVAVPPLGYAAPGEARSVATTNAALLRFAPRSPLACLPFHPSARLAGCWHDGDAKL